MNVTPRSFLAVSALLASQVAVTSERSRRPAGEVTRRLKAAPPLMPGRAKIGRNEPCPCGSGKKFKACHLRPAPV